MGVGKVAEVVCEFHEERLLEEPPALRWGQCSEGRAREHGSGPRGRRGAARVAGDEKRLVFKCFIEESRVCRGMWDWGGRELVGAEEV